MIATPATVPSSDYITLAEAAKCFPKVEGKHPSIQSVKRRIIKGAFGVRLRGIKSGRRWFTTAAWIHEFENALTNKAVPVEESRPEESPLPSRADHRLAEERLLKEHGIDVRNPRARKTTAGRKKMSRVR